MTACAHGWAICASGSRWLSRRATTGRTTYAAVDADRLQAKRHTRAPAGALWLVARAMLAHGDSVNLAQTQQHAARDRGAASSQRDAGPQVGRAVRTMR